MPSISVTTPQATYNVTIAPGLLRTLQPLLHKLTANPAQKTAPKLFVITSPNIWALWHKKFLASFPPGAQPTTLFLPPGESHKRLAQVESLAQQLAQAGADRDSILLAFGGGVIGDVTGFLAAIYMRGIRYVGLPTTLLAQVDSSLGGKTGVNLPAGKNLIGAFHHPIAVLSDIDLLATLPPAELRSGLQEAIKAGIIRSPSLFRYLEANADRILGGAGAPHLASQMWDPSALQHVVTASVRVKAEVVSKDEKESGLRMILNFGHTIGHAIEAATRYRTLLHGEAIAWGMIAALHVSLARRAITQRDHDRMAALILRYGPIPPFKIAASPHAAAQKLVALTSADKKVRSGRRAFVLTTGIGSTAIAHDVTDPELLTATRAMFTTMRSAASEPTSSDP
ncbi:MAG: 3-dehydroquinate synthase [Acidobacteriaceae bacterium]